jgi:hypothetical protein
MQTDPAELYTRSFYSIDDLLIHDNEWLHNDNTEHISTHKNQTSKFRVYKHIQSIKNWP